MESSSPDDRLTLDDMLELCREGNFELIMIDDTKDLTRVWVSIAGLN